jgi:ParB family chromosome partitioning protein
MKTKKEQPEQEALKSKRKDYFQVDPKNIVVKNGFNIREDMGDMLSLMQSIQELGLQIPIKAKKIYGTEQYELIDGHRRMLAINGLIENGVEIDYVDVIIFSGDESDKILSMLVTGTGQKPLTEFEQSEGIGRLVDVGERPDDIAKKIGKSTPHVYHLLKIYSLPEKYKQKIKEGYISGYTMLELFEQYSEEELDEELEAVINDAQKSSKSGEIKKATQKNVKKEKVLKPIEKFDLLVKECEDRIAENIHTPAHSLIVDIYYSLFEEDDQFMIQIIDTLDWEFTNLKSK